MTGQEQTPPPANDLRDDEPWPVIVVVNAIRQARQGKPHDPWEWDVCTQEDVDRARRVVAAIAAWEQEGHQLPPLHVITADR